LQEVVFTMQPRKHGVNILKHRYSLIKKYILTILEEEGPSCYNYVNYRISDTLKILVNQIKGRRIWI